MRVSWGPLGNTRMVQEFKRTRFNSDVEVHIAGMSCCVVAKNSTFTRNLGP